MRIGHNNPEPTTAARLIAQCLQHDAILWAAVFTRVSPPNLPLMRRSAAAALFFTLKEKPMSMNPTAPEPLKKERAIPVALEEQDKALEELALQVTNLEIELHSVLGPEPASPPETTAPESPCTVAGRLRDQKTAVVMCAEKLHALKSRLEL